MGVSVWLYCDAVSAGRGWPGNYHYFPTIDILKHIFIHLHFFFTILLLVPLLCLHISVS